MVHRLLRLTGRGLLFALCLTCAHAPLWAQSRAAPPAAQAIAPASPAAAGGLISNVKRTRFLIGLPKSTEFAVFSLNNPNRVIVEISETKLRLPEQPKNGPVGLIKSFRAGQSAANRSRIIINVTEPVIVASAKIEKGGNGHHQQLIVEIAPFGRPAPVPAAAPAPTPPPTTPAAFATASLGDMVAAAAKSLTGTSDSNSISPPMYALGAGSLQPPTPRPAVSPEVLAERAFKPVIVIDPGHGGHDSGAEKNGAVEKDIVLAFGKILAEKLKATGRFKVLMTRDEDVFVPLGERVEFAERHKANLFIAVHCDYADTGSKANGATIYSLREFDGRSLAPLRQGRALQQPPIEG